MKRLITLFLLSFVALISAGQDGVRVNGMAPYFQGNARVKGVFGVDSTTYLKDTIYVTGDYDSTLFYKDSLVLKMIGSFSIAGTFNLDSTSSFRDTISMIGDYDTTLVYQDSSKLKIEGNIRAIKNNYELINDSTEYGASTYYLSGSYLKDAENYYVSGVAYTTDTNIVMNFYNSSTGLSKNVVVNPTKVSMSFLDNGSIVSTVEIKDDSTRIVHDKNKVILTDDSVSVYAGDTLMVTFKNKPNLAKFYVNASIPTSYCQLLADSCDSAIVVTSALTYYRTEYQRDTSFKSDWIVTDTIMKYDGYINRSAIMHISGNVSIDNDSSFVMLAIYKNATTKYGDTRIWCADSLGRYSFNATVFVPSIVHNDYFDLRATSYNNGDAIRIKELNWFIEAK